MRFFYSCLIAFLLLGCSLTVRATHIYGADFFYTHLSGNTYRITLTVYGDCAGSAFPSLENGAPTVDVHESGAWRANLLLSQAAPAVEVTPVCPKQAPFTTCKGDDRTIYNVPGVTRYIYSAIYEVPYRSTEWVFRFTGGMGNGFSAGRTNSITNIYIGTGPGTGSVMILEALLNNAGGSQGADSNSSPEFTTIPTPFYCINIAQQYNQGAVDADHDSLVYALAPGIQGTSYVSYNSGYSATSPLHTVPGSFFFSTSTGQMGFTPDIIQQSLVVNQVKEYRNGILVGTASREMTFIVLNNCVSSPEYSVMDTSASSVLGGVPTVSSFHICQGTDSIHFNIIPLKPGIDTINASINGLPPGMKASIAANGTPKPLITIDWKTQMIPVGRYNFFVTYRDNDCPFSSTQTQAYTIEIINRPIARFTGPDEICQSDTAIFMFNGVVGPGPDFRYVWDWGHPAFAGGKDGGPWRVHWLGSGVKTIRMRVIENNCPSEEVERKILLRPAPYAGFATKSQVCLYDTIRVEHFRDYTKPLDKLTFAWSFAGADTPSASGPGPYTIRWNDTAGLRRLSLTMTYEGCTDTRTTDVMVRPLPPVRITNAPGRVCIGDKIFLNAVGGSRFIWQPADSLIHTPEGTMYAQILKPSVYRVIAFSDQGCIDSTAISYNDVEPCCNFAYPNAFTPNNDGRNDRFRAVTYGNHLQYELSIYNNWGQRVYYGLEAKEGWDGNFNGKPCDAGTYFYFVNAMCFTGHKESYKGTLHLVR